MGTGFHGGFGDTFGSKVVILSPTFAGDENNLKIAAKWIKPKSGYTDIVIHGTPDYALIKIGNDWVEINHRVLARMYKGDKGYSKNSIRLISCETGRNVGGFAQNLTNKLGRKVIAPSDMVWIHPSGKMTIGPNAWSNTGKWISYRPKKGDN